MADWNVSIPHNTMELNRMLAESGGTLIAGGTDLLPGLHRTPVDHPVHLIDMSQLTELRFIREEAGMIEIGALTTHSAMEKSPVLLKHAPSLAKSCSEIGSPQTRARGTLGGNLVNASPAADTAPPLMCLDAEAHLSCSEGQRSERLLDFFRSPGKTCLQPGEFLRSVRFAIPSGKWGSSCMRLGCRKGMSIAVVGVSVFLVLDDAGIIRQIRIALGSVAPTTVRALSAEAELLGQRPAKDLFLLAARAMDADINPITDVRASADYRRHSARILLNRSLEEACKQAEGRRHEYR